MVQRKVGNVSHLALQPHHLKTQNLLQHQDVKSKVADLKTKKMKKSGSIKRPEFNSPRSPNIARKPKKPATMATTTPNYMKSTTSFDARKEQSRADTSSSRRKCSNNSKLTSGKNSIAKTSLKALTKNPSFKPGRTSLVRKCSTVVLCENLDAKRATCSSTLKDCKFPAYLSLNPGGTELEGTSTIKVCPYTYCSLNGHHHAPLPPLKAFLSARRVMLKAQRSIKLGCLSPRRVKPVLKSSKFSPLNEEEHTEFFVEIYTKKKEDIDRNTVIDVSAEDQEERVVETLLDALICGDSISMDSEQNQEVEHDGAVSPPLLVQEEGKMGFLSELPVESCESNDRSYEIDSEASDMDWETGEFSALILDYAYEYAPEIELESDLEAGKVESSIIHDDFIIKSDKKDVCFDELLADEVSQESFNEESLNSDTFSNSDDGESISSYDDLHNLNNMKTSAPVEVPAEEPEISPSGEDQTSKTEIQEDSVANFTTSSPIDPEKEPDSTEAKRHMVHKVKAKNAANQESEEDCVLALARGNCKKTIEEKDEFGVFNPREPNFLPIEPEPESEKVNLRHQDLDEKKNAEEWMVDYALRQTVTKLGPARKRKVALLVEAFEKVMPITKCEIQLRQTSMFDQARPMQACS